MLGVLDRRVEGKCVKEPTKQLFQALSFLLFLFGALGNFAYLAVTIRSYQELNVLDLFLVGLAALDLIASIILPLFYFLEISEVLLYVTDSSCRFIVIMHELSVVLTVYLLLFAVHAFYKKVVLRKVDGNKKLRFFIIVIFCMLITIIPAIPVAIDTFAEDGRCHVFMRSFSSVVVYDVVLLIIQIICPLLFFTAMFAQLGVHLRLNHQGEVDDEANLTLVDHAANRRKLGLLLLITCFFFLLFIPYVTANLWFLLDGGRILLSQFYCHLFDIFHLLICAKCLVNPLIYIIYQEGFRENLKRVICGFRIGRRYNFMQIKYHFRRDVQSGILEDQGEQMEDGQLVNEMNEWRPGKRIAATTPPDPDLELNENEHDYEDEDDVDRDDNVAILKPWRNLRSTSTF